MTTSFEYTLSDLIPVVRATADQGLAERLQQRIDRKTKPVGALGRLEALALQLGMIQGSDAPQLRDPQLMVFAADHGLATRGVSAYPQDVTWQMVENMLAGGAAISVLARQHGLALTVVDAGVARELAPRPGLVLRKIAPGTRDASTEAAMDEAQCMQAIAAGRTLVKERPGNALMLGEMGIGNTSSAALLMSRLTGVPIEQCIGRGTGLDDLGLARKTAVLTQALQRHQDATTPLQALAALGGFEIAMMTGAVLQAAHERRVILVDGFIVSSAVLVAQELAPAVKDYCIYSHCSDESGHKRMLEAMGGEPLLSLGLRLGEGTGAALAWPLLDSAARLLQEMASFESAGVSDRGA